MPKICQKSQNCVLHVTVQYREILKGDFMLKTQNVIFQHLHVFWLMHVMYYVEGTSLHSITVAWKCEK
jgi:hypothetical protein